MATFLFSRLDAIAVVFIR